MAQPPAMIPLTERREAVGITAYKLAALASMSVYSLGRCLRGERVMRPSEAQRLDAVLTTLERAQREAQQAAAVAVGAGAGAR